MTLKDTHYTAHIRDPKFSGECLLIDERIQKTEFIHKAATRKIGTEHSAEVMAELAEYRNRKGFFGKVFVLNSPSVTDSTVW
jgi:hypothetical protein